MNTRITTVVAFAAACLAGSSAYGKHHTTSTKDDSKYVKPMKKVVEPVQESCITGDIGFDIVSNYINHGVVIQNQGFIIQPYADLHFRIYKGAGALTSVTADIGIWNSFHGHHVGGVGTTANWYEFDFQTGLTFNFNKLSLGTFYKVYESPSSSFANTYTAGVNLAYDDSDMLGAIALHPYLLVELQLEGSNGNNFPSLIPGRRATAFHGRGQYYEVGIAPAHTIGNLTLSLPIKGGFGSGGFYLGNRSFGFASVGIRADYALNFVPACLGKWSVSSSFTYARLGGSNKLNTRNPAGAAGLGFSQITGRTSTVDNNELIFQGGLKVAF